MASSVQHYCYCYENCKTNLLPQSPDRDLNDSFDNYIYKYYFGNTLFYLGIKIDLNCMCIYLHDDDNRFNI